MRFADADDRELLDACIAGDPDAGETMVRRFSNLVYATIQKTLASKHVSYVPEDMEDFHNLIFEVLFEKNCKKLRQYEGKNGCSLATWIRTVTVRTILNQLRKKGADSITGRNFNVPIEDIANIMPDASDTWEMVEQSERLRLLREATDTLASRDRLFFRLHIEQGLSIPEVSELMDISPKNAYTLKHRAIQKIKAHISEVIHT